MRLGIVSDTHNRLPNIRRLVDLFNNSGADLVVHTGDVASPAALEAFVDLKVPMTGVWGNNDLPREALQRTAEQMEFRFQEAPLRLELAGRRLVVTHDPRDLDAIAPDYDVALHGHTHRYRLETLFSGSKSRLIFNPGECAGMMPDLNAVGLLDLKSLKTELLRF